MESAKRVLIELQKYKKWLLGRADNLFLFYVANLIKIVDTIKTNQAEKTHLISFFCEKALFQPYFMQFVNIKNRLNQLKEYVFYKLETSVCDL